ncbi:high mobility group box domain-containing protein [Mycena latifolia]|nr:high mobility group box domain-containing protein [Mycena latifolia]
MPPIREHITLYTFLAEEDDADDDEQDGPDEEDDTDMPPLVDAPGPAPAVATQESMMSSFPFDFSGVSFGRAPFAPTLIHASAHDEVDDAPRGGRGGRAAVRRAPSYIPRPPNAFILFRSSFIRSQNVPGRVEGNHSTLSKIIGKYWHALPPAERARWEDKARAAQAEHRRRYPDWRFRPGNGKRRVVQRAHGHRPPRAYARMEARGAGTCPLSLVVSLWASAQPAISGAAEHGDGRGLGVVIEDRRRPEGAWCGGRAYSLA